MHVATMVGRAVKGARWVALVAAAAAAAAAVAVPTTTLAQERTPVYWADWQSSLMSDGRGTVYGTMNVGGTAVGLRYEGELDFAATLPGGTEWFAPRESYLGSVLRDGTPITSDIIALSGGTGIRNTFLFDRPITNPVMSIFSLGRGSTPVEYVFDASFELLAGGPGAFGGTAVTQPAANTVRGLEGNGTIRFLGTYSSISFETVGGESWSGFTLGVQGLATDPGQTVTPEPASVALMATGLAGVGVIARRRRRAASTA